MGKMYCISDIHGIYPIFEQIKNFLRPDDKCYVLGDCADRGSEGWRIIKEVIKDDRFIYLKGNHEEMLVKSCGTSDGYTFGSEDHSLWMNNGGEQTYLDWLYDINRSEWLNIIKKLPTHAIYVNKNGKEIRLSHAGYTPGYYANSILPYDEDLLWDRRHVKQEWNEEEFPNTIIVHGHTPSLHVDMRLGAEVFKDIYNPTAYWYCNNHKVCIDCGTYATGIAVMLDLDTFEEHIFTTQL